MSVQSDFFSGVRARKHWWINRDHKHFPTLLKSIKKNKAIVSEKIFLYERSDLTLIFNTISAYIKTRIVSYDKLFYTILMEICHFLCISHHHRRYDVIIFISGLKAKISQAQQKSANYLTLSQAYSDANVVDTNHIMR